MSVHLRELASTDDIADEFLKSRLQDLRAQSLLGEKTFLVAEADGRPIALLCLLNDDSLADALLLHEIQVRKDIRNQGYGFAVMNELEAWVRAQGVGWLIGDPVPMDDSVVDVKRLEAFYERCGHRKGDYKDYEDYWAKKVNAGTP